ncbi:hypothetical protein [Methanofollis fontis]|nr:hypothetical protein [Methanofollis fontis]
MAFVFAHAPFRPTPPEASSAILFHEFTLWSGAGGLPGGKMVALPGS